MVNVSSFLWTSAGQKADGITPTHTHVEDLNHVVLSLIIRLGWHRRSSGQLHNRLDYLSEQWLSDQWDDPNNLRPKLKGLRGLFTCFEYF